jgi:hypothetical protein
MVPAYADRERPHAGGVPLYVPALPRTIQVGSRGAELARGLAAGDRLVDAVRRRILQHLEVVDAAVRGSSR